MPVPCAHANHRRPLPAFSCTASLTHHCSHFLSSHANPMHPCQPHTPMPTPCTHATPKRPCHRYETTNHLWLILEYCVGGDLMSLLRQVGPTQPIASCSLIDQSWACRSALIARLLDLLTGVARPRPATVACVLDVKVQTLSATPEIFTLCVGLRTSSSTWLLPLHGLLLPPINELSHQSSAHSPPRIILVCHSHPSHASAHRMCGCQRAVCTTLGATWWWLYSTCTTTASSIATLRSATSLSLSYPCL